MKGYTREIVERVAANMWGNDSVPGVMKLLDEYVDDSETRRARVHLAILKLSRGEIGKLPGLIGDAGADYRDILGSAEYPETMATTGELSVTEREQISDRDFAQYRVWLESVGASEVEPVT